MADAPPRQGWRVPQRVPAIAAVATLGLIAVLLVIAGHAYRARIRPHRALAVQTFPAPGIETYVHDGQGDPPRPPPPPRRDAAIEAAKQAVVREGIVGWPR